MAIVAIVLSRPLSLLFVGYDAELCDMTTRGFVIFAFHFLICGFNIFGSAFFTALNNGVVSALISFLRTFAFQAVAVLILPRLFGLDGIWYALFVAEILAMAVTGWFYRTRRSQYHY